MADIKNVIETDGLTRRFGQFTAVANLDLRVPAGSVYAFLGPNGAGKTTTMRLLLGLIRPSAGQVRLLGASLEHGRGHALGRVGSLVETPSLYPHLTGRENLEVIRRLRGGTQVQVDRALALVHLEDAADRLAGQYSLGMCQRLGLAIALLGSPSVLLLDEPTNGLDPAGIHEIRELIRRLPGEQGVSIFISSHLLSEVEQIATHVGIIRDGRLVFQGTPDELRARYRDHVLVGADRPAAARSWLQAQGWQIGQVGGNGANGNGTGHPQPDTLFRPADAQGPANDRPGAGGYLQVAVNGAADAALLGGQLIRAGFGIYHLALEQPSLEDIFLQMTDVSAEKQGVKA